MPRRRSAATMAERYDPHVRVESEAAVSAILVEGVLTGMGRETKCEVLVWQNGRSKLRPYSQFRVIGAPLDLPDGDYVVAFCGRAFSTRRRHGWWVMESLF